MAEPNIEIKLDINELASLFKREKIQDVYKKMQQTAEEQASQEALDFLLELQMRRMEKKISGLGEEEKFDVMSKSEEFRKERVTFHMNQLLELLHKKLESNI